MKSEVDPKDWGEISEAFDDIKEFVKNKDLTSTSEAQTRFDIIDRIIREVLQWKHGQIEVEELDVGNKIGYVDYILRSNGSTIIIEAKKIGATFPIPTRKKKLKLTGSVLGVGEISYAINQAEEYAKNKNADLVVVTNGLCWCFYPLKDKTNRDEIYASLLFPFTKDNDIDMLFKYLSSTNVENGSLNLITGDKPLVPERKLIYEVKDSDARIDRNNIADFITPALNLAFYSESLLNNKEQLERCFVTTQGRTKFDTTLGIHLSDSKSSLITPAKRINTNKESGHLKSVLEESIPSYAPPVTLIIGQVGAGKSTYLKHFELVTGQEVLENKKIHWIYIDFESMGKSGNPRDFIYSELKKYLLSDHPSNPTDYKSVIEPAYEEDISGLARGPYSLIYQTDKSEFKKIITEYIARDFEKIEPYVDKIFKHITKSNLCVVVLDNIDLYEDEELETLVFSEGVALSKRIHCNIIASLRDRTYIKHRNDSSFDAYELRKLWLDPPPFKAVLSNRFSYSKIILDKKSAQIPLENAMKLNVPDLSVFFDIVQKSILSGSAGDFIDSLADNNIRRGLTLVTNFLTSGHIQADRAIKNYIEGDQGFTFPFHEIFKGSVLGQWKYYREGRAECINVFDSGLGVKTSRLLRLYLLKHLWYAAKSDSSKEVPTVDFIDIFSKLGISENQIITCLNNMDEFGLLRNISAESINADSQIVITRRGGFYIKYLSHKMPYVEACIYDTAIDDDDAWEVLSNLTTQIENEPYIPKRMEMRRERLLYFLDYMSDIEAQNLKQIGNYDYLQCLDQIKKDITVEADMALTKSYRWHS